MWRGACASLVVRPNPFEEGQLRCKRYARWARRKALLRDTCAVPFFFLLAKKRRHFGLFLRPMREDGRWVVEKKKQGKERRVSNTWWLLAILGEGSFFFFPPMHRILITHWYLRIYIYIFIFYLFVYLIYFYDKAIIRYWRSIIWKLKYLFIYFFYFLFLNWIYCELFWFIYYSFTKIVIWWKF